MATRCLISLGANLGDRAHGLEQALQKLAAHPQIDVIRVSRTRETSPAGGPAGQARFLNAAAVLETSLSPQALLALLLQIEAEAGRTRDVRWGPRPLDLDLLLYEDAILAEPSLVAPHPRMAWRRFVLEPAAEIAPEMMHPGIGWSVARLLQHLNSTPYYAAIAGAIGVGKTELAKRLTEGNAWHRIDEQVDSQRLAAFYANPASLAWPMELEFLRQRCRLLASDAIRWGNDPQPTVSDFWFDQSEAFARVWLPPERYREYCEHFGVARRTVVRPRLVVLLEARGEELRERVVRRGRPFERDLTAETLERIARAIDRQTRQPDVGPVLRIAGDCRDTVADEVSAAVVAMK